MKLSISQVPHHHFPGTQQGTIWGSARPTSSVERSWPCQPGSGSLERAGSLRGVVGQEEAWVPARWAPVVSELSCSSQCPIWCPHHLIPLLGEVHPSLGPSHIKGPETPPSPRALPPISAAKPIGIKKHLGNRGLDQGPHYCPQGSPRSDTELHPNNSVQPKAGIAMSLCLRLEA